MIGTILAVGLVAGVLQEPVVPAAATLEIHDSVNVSAIQTLTLRRPEGGQTLGMTVITEAEKPALIQISGDAGRLYRIQVRESGGPFVGNDLRIWSTNTGDISESHISTTDAHGRDLLHISGRLTRRVGSTGDRRTLAVSIQYD